MKSLTFSNLRAANVLRQTKYPMCESWTPAQWLQALVGELGEYANFRKKYERGDMSYGEFRAHAAKELADVQIYLDILAQQLGIDLGMATLNKFNEVSERRGLDVWLEPDRVVVGKQP